MVSQYSYICALVRQSGCAMALQTCWESVRFGVINVNCLLLGIWKRASHIVQMRRDSYF